MPNPQDPRSYFDPEYPRLMRVEPAVTSVPLKVAPLHPATVYIISDESREQKELDKRFPGDLMTGTPSIALHINGRNVYMTWAEAYNLGRALMDKANEAFYG